MPQSVLPMLSSLEYLVLHLGLIYFQFDFVYGVRECSNFILLHVSAQFSQHHYCRDCLFSTVYSCFLCHRLIDHKCVGLFLSFLSCTIDPYVSFMPVPREDDFSSSFPLSQDCFVFFQGLLHFNTKFKINCSSSVRMLLAF